MIVEDSPSKTEFAVVEKTKNLLFGFEAEFGVPRRMLPRYPRGDDLDEQDFYYKWAASRVREFTGKPVRYFSAYHARSKSSSDWYVEPDETLVVQKGDLGVEAVSPVFPFSDGLDVLDRFLAWMDDSGFYTNESMGLHANFSVPGRPPIDFLKIALFTDQDYVADLFKRKGNPHADIINIETWMRSRRIGNSQWIDRYSDAVFDQFFSELNNDPVKERVMAELQTLFRMRFSDKYQFFSIEKYNESGIVEFRIIGNEDYQTKRELIRKKLVLFAWLMALGTDETLYRKEYLRKLFRTIQRSRHNPNNPMPSDDPVMRPIARFVGNLRTATAFGKFRNDPDYADRVLERILENIARASAQGQPPTRREILSLRQFIRTSLLPHIDADDLQEIVDEVGDAVPVAELIA